MVYGVIVAILFAGDFFLKRQVEEKIEKDQQHEVCGGKIVIQKYYNNGAALNFMEKRPKVLRSFCGGIVLIVGIIWYLFLREKRNPGNRKISWKSAAACSCGNACYLLLKGSKCSEVSLWSAGIYCNFRSSCFTCVEKK